MNSFAFTRLADKVLSQAEMYDDYPCHRVFNHAGCLVPGFLDQRMLLEQEGVTFKENGS